MNFAPVGYVNIHGDPVVLKPSKQKRRVVVKDAFHNGWRVVGIPPGALEAAERQHNADIAYAQSQAKKKVPEPWSAERWLNKARRRAVRAKPYEIPEAAKLCAEMAEKEGWLRVEIREIKKD